MWLDFKNDMDIILMYFCLDERKTSPVKYLKELSSGSPQSLSEICGAIT